MCRINILACLFITVLFWSCTEKTENTTTFSYTNDGKQVENIIIEAPKDTNYRYDSMLDRKYFYPIEKFLYTQFHNPAFIMMILLSTALQNINGQDFLLRTVYIIQITPK